MPSVMSIISMFREMRACQKARADSQSSSFLEALSEDQVRGFITEIKQTVPAEYTDISLYKKCNSVLNLASIEKDRKLRYHILENVADTFIFMSSPLPEDEKHPSVAQVYLEMHCSFKH